MMRHLYVSGRIGRRFTASTAMKSLSVKVMSLPLSLHSKWRQRSDSRAQLEGPPFGLLWNVALTRYRHHCILGSVMSARQVTNDAGAALAKQEGKGLLRLLTVEQRNLLSQQKQLIERINALSKDVGPGAAQQFVRYRNGHPSLPVVSDDSVEFTFTIVVVGEFNAGKSTVINALLGLKLLETGALPTTDSIVIVANDEGTPNAQTSTQHESLVCHHFFSSTHDIPLLRDLTFIDTPGTNAVSTAHTTKIIQLLPNADLILFITSADRPFSESERVLLSNVQAYRKNIVICINKMDILELSGGNHGEFEKARIVQFVTEHASALLGARPIVFPISARDAISFKLMQGSYTALNRSSGGDYVGDDPNTRVAKKGGIWQRSGFEALESFLKDTLTEETKVRSKLLNPVGVAEGMLNDCLNVLKARQIELDTDVATVNLLKSQMKGWSRDIESDMTNFRAEIRDLLNTEKSRCKELVDGMNMRKQWSWLYDANGAKFEVEWSYTKQGITSGNSIQEEVLRLVRDCSDTVATLAQAQSQAVMEYLGKRPAVTGKKFIGSITAASRFDDTRKELAGQMNQTVRLAFATYDEALEQTSVLQSFRTTMLLSIAFHLVAMITGVMTATEMLTFLNGGLAASTFAVIGVAVFPFRNKRTITEYEDRWEKRINKLDASLEALSTKELQRIHKRILDGIAPYIRYVETEQERVQQLTDDCEDQLSNAQRLRGQINKI